MPTFARRRHGGHVFAQPPNMVAAVDGHGGHTAGSGDLNCEPRRELGGGLTEPPMPVHRGNRPTAPGHLGGWRRPHLARLDETGVLQEPDDPVRVVADQVGEHQRRGHHLGLRLGGAEADEDACSQVLQIARRERLAQFVLPRRSFRRHLDRRHDRLRQQTHRFVVRPLTVARKYWTPGIGQRLVMGDGVFWSGEDRDRTQVTVRDAGISPLALEVVLILGQREQRRVVAAQHRIVRPP